MSSVRTRLVKDPNNFQMRTHGSRSDGVFGGEHELIIEPGRTERHYWRDLWRYRELFQVLAWRDLSVRYKQTVIGAAWAVIRPLLTMVVFTIIFGRIAQVAVGWVGALCADGLCRHVAVDLFLNRPVLMPRTAWSTTPI